MDAKDGPAQPPRRLVRELMAQARGRRPDLLWQALGVAAASATGVAASARDMADRRLADLVPAWRTPLQVYFGVRDLVHQVTGLTCYPREIPDGMTLRTLATYLCGELDPWWQGRAPALFEEPTDDARCRWPTPTRYEGPCVAPCVFLLGSPRSGTTLLRTMLAGHSRLCVPGELNLLPFDYLGDRAHVLQALGFSWMIFGAQEALGDALGRPALWARVETARATRQNRPVAESYRRLQEAGGGRLLVDKSPLYTLHAAWMARAESLAPGSRYIYLTRHPFSVMESFVRRRFHRMLGPVNQIWDPHPWGFAEKVWAGCNRNVVAFLDTVPPDRQMRVSFEALVTEPEREMRRLAAFLGVAYEPALVHPFDGARMASVRLAGRVEASIGDPGFLERRSIDPALGSAWTSVRLPRPPAPVTRRVARRLGYDVGA